MEGSFYLSKGCKDDREVKKDNIEEFHKDIGEDKNSADDDIRLDAKPDVNSEVDLVRPKKVEKEVSAMVKSGVGKIANLKLMGNFVTNYLVGITLLENPTSNILDEANIATANLLADLIANSFNVVSFFNLFVVFANSFVKGSSLDILMVANFVFTSTKSFTISFVTSVGSCAIVPIDSSAIAPLSSSLFGLFESLAITPIR